MRALFGRKSMYKNNKITTVLVQVVLMLIDFLYRHYLHRY